MSKPPPVTVAPPAPAPDDDAVRQRAQQEAASLYNTGTPSTIKTDLDPTKLVGNKRILLGQ